MTSTTSSVGEHVVAADALTVELRRRPRDARADARVRKLVMDGACGIDDRRARLERLRHQLREARPPQEHAHQTGQLPERLAETVEALVVEHRDADRRQA
jgi:hypothetical protein